MDIRQTAAIAWRNLVASKLRFVQTLLGVIVGVAAVVVILSVQQGAVRQIDAMYQEYSPSLMTMITYQPIESSQNFSETDMEQLAAANPEYITAVSPLIYLQDAAIKYVGQTYEDFGAMGVGEQYMEISPLLHIAEGRFLQTMDISREQRVCVVTRVVADEALGGDALGKELRIMGESFQVVGVLEDIAGDQEQFNGAVYIPYSVAKKMQPDDIVTMAPESSYSGDYYIRQYYVNANGMDNIANARVTVNDALQAVYGENAVHYSASFRYYRQGELAPIYSAAKKLLAAAGVVLLVGGVGIMNMMLAVVTERVREIGIRKAFGARMQDIRRQFIVEAASTSVVGGVVGVALGVPGSYIACTMLELPASWISVSVLAAPVLLALVVAVCIGVLFGFVPANKAAKIEIVQAINSD